MAAVFTHPENKSGVFFFLFNSNFSFFIQDFLSLDVQKFAHPTLFFSFVRGCISLPAFRYSSLFSTRFIFIAIILLNDLSSEYVSPAKYSMQVIFEIVFLTFFLVFFPFFVLAFQLTRKKENNGYSIIHVYITILI